MAIESGSFIEVNLEKVKKRLEWIWDRHYEKCVIISYWFLGLCNNFAYVIMLSAAHDILERPNNNQNGTSTTSNETNRYDCNDISTGAVLLADILPGIAIKLVAPFFAHKIGYSYRVVMVVIVNTCSYLLVAITPAEYKWLIFIGVMCASLSSSFGEITFLSLSTLYSRSLSLTGWGSGTGAAGLIGSFGYAGLTSIGLSPRNTILIMLFIPVLMATSYVALPSISFTKSRTYNDFGEDSKEKNDKDSDMEEFSSEVKVITSSQTSIEPINTNNTHKTIMDAFLEKLMLVRPLLKYMIPLFLVYYAEYFINQGLFELLYFKDDSLIKSHKDQYRWYNVVYQLTVFISRTSIRWVQIKYLVIFPIFQLINVCIALSQVYWDYIPSIWLVFLLIFWEGLLGGGCYVNAFNLVSVEIPKENREFSIAITSIADSIGISLAGLTAIPVYNAFCDYGKR